MKNIAILAHVDAGKTSLTESFLSMSGKALGSVDAGTTTTDSNEIERQRGISIYTATTSINYNDVKINIIDTPGHMDFINEVEQALMVCDIAVLLIAANDQEIKVQTRSIYKKLKELEIPTIAFINKIDLPSANVALQVERIKSLTEGHAELIHNEEGLLDTLTLLDTRLMTSVLNDTLTPKDVEESMHAETMRARFMPILMGSATRMLGIDELLDFIVRLPSESIPTSELSGLIYKKTYSDEGKLRTFIRLYGGEVHSKDSILYKDEHVLVKHLYGVTDGTIEKVDCVKQNDVAIIEGLGELEIGTWIGTPLKNKVMPTWTKGHYNVLVVPQAGTRVALINALHRMMAINPFIEMEINEANQEISLVLIGVIQKEIISSSLNDEYGLNPKLSDAKVIYKKRPIKITTHTVYMNTIENSNWATMQVRLEPLEIGCGFVYETLVNTGYLRRGFQNAIVEALEHLTCAPHEGLHVTDYKLTLVDAEFSSPVSTPSDFRHATAVVYHKIMDDMSFDYLEPTGSFTLLIPNHALKKAYHDLTLFDATIRSVEYDEDLVEISGEMLLRHGINYQNSVLSYTNGYGSFEVRPQSYQRVNSDDKACFEL